MNLLLALDQCHEGKIVTATVSDGTVKLKIVEGKLYAAWQADGDTWQEVGKVAFPTEFFIAKWKESEECNSSLVLLS